jgi:hypothetical protein
MLLSLTRIKPVLTLSKTDCDKKESERKQGAGLLSVR